MSGTTSDDNSRKRKLSTNEKEENIPPRKRQRLEEKKPEKKIVHKLTINIMNDAAQFDVTCLKKIPYFKNCGTCIEWVNEDGKRVYNDTKGTKYVFHDGSTEFKLSSVQFNLNDFKNMRMYLSAAGEHKFNHITDLAAFGGIILCCHEFNVKLKLKILGQKGKEIDDKKTNIESWKFSQCRLLTKLYYTLRGNGKLWKEKVMHGLRKIFETIEQAADLTHGAKSKILPTCPGLCIEGIGEIPLPICPQQLEILLSKASKSSYGDGLETGNDENVRKSHEFTADKFHFENPEWNKQIENVFNKIAIKLGCTVENVKYVKGYPYKLLIYQKDGHFVEHRDTQKAEGMFATLIVQLPSKYQVVDDKPILSVKHKDDIYEYYFGASQDKERNYDCAYNVYYAAHYCDLVHQVNTIKSGTRLSITYNICWEGPRNIAPSVSNIDKVTSGIDTLLESWDIDDQRSPIGIRLDHVYTKKELSKNGVNALKARDFAKVYALLQSNSGQKVCVCTLCSSLTNGVRVFLRNCEFSWSAQPGTC